MKRTADERRIFMKRDKRERAIKAKDYPSANRKETRNGRRSIVVNPFGGIYGPEGSRSTISGRKFFSRLKSKRNRQNSVYEMKNQLMDKIMLDQEERLRIEELYMD